MNIENFLKNIKFDNNGLVQAIAQDSTTGEVLMLAYMNKESIEKTLEKGVAVYWSRSRKSLWIKGEVSGNIQKLEGIFLDCDGDAILLKIKQLADGGKSDFGAACHTGYRTCFYRQFENGNLVEKGEKLFNPDDVYKKK